METLYKKYPPDAYVIVDVTSKAPMPWVQFSPFYPVENLPVPFADQYPQGPQTASSVEGIWQGLKIFTNEGVDLTKFSIRTLKNLKRSVNAGEGKRGRVIGHAKGVGARADHPDEILGYLAARLQIYLPTYQAALDGPLAPLVVALENLLDENPTKTLVLLDYETNTDVENLKTPLSHASLIAQHLVRRDKQTSVTHS